MQRIVFDVESQEYRVLDQDGVPQWSWKDRVVKGLLGVAVTGVGSFRNANIGTLLTAAGVNVAGVATLRDLRVPTLASVQALNVNAQGSVQNLNVGTLAQLRALAVGDGTGMEGFFGGTGTTAIANIPTAGTLVASMALPALGTGNPDRVICTPKGSFVAGVIGVSGRVVASGFLEVQFINPNPASVASQPPLGWAVSSIRHAT